MRTTLTLDDHVVQRLKELAQRRGVSFRALVNELLLDGLNRPERLTKRSEPFVVESFHSAFRPGIDPMKLNQLVDELEVRDATGRGR